MSSQRGRETQSGFAPSPILRSTPLRRIGGSRLTSSPLPQSGNTNSLVPSSPSHTRLSPNGLSLAELLEIKDFLNSGAESRRARVAKRAKGSKQEEDLFTLIQGAGKRATRVIDLQSYARVMDGHAHWFELKKQNISAERRAEIAPSAAFWEEVLLKLPKYRRSLIHGDFAHRALDNKGPEMIQWVTEKILNGCTQARSDDSGALKPIILSFIPRNDMNDNETIERLLSQSSGKGKGKVLRGYNNRVTARLLCPLDLVAQFDEDPASMIADLQTNKEGIASEEFLPLVLFDEDLVDFTKGLIENKHAFMRGPIVIRCWKYIFLGPATSTSLNFVPAGTRLGKNNAGSALMTQVTVPTIAYAATQAVFGLSSIEAWSNSDVQTGFDCRKFYNNMRKLLEIESYAHSVLTWWHTHVWGGSRASLRGIGDADSGDDSDSPENQSQARNTFRRFLEQLKSQEQAPVTSNSDQRETGTTGETAENDMNNNRPGPLSHPATSQTAQIDTTFYARGGNTNAADGQGSTAPASTGDTTEDAIGNINQPQDDVPYAPSEDEDSALVARPRPRPRPQPQPLMPRREGDVSSSTSQPPSQTSDNAATIQRQGYDDGDESGPIFRSHARKRQRTDQDTSGAVSNETRDVRVSARLNKGLRTRNA